MKKLFVFVSSLTLFFFLSGCARPPLQQAALKGDSNTVKALLDQGTDVNEKDYAGFTPLIAASGNGQIGIVKVLLDRGADINATGQGGGIQNSSSYSNMSGTALSFAAQNGYTDIARLLVEKGADIDKAIMLLENYNNTESAVEFLKEIKRERVASQSVTLASKSSQEAFPVIKSDVDELRVVKVKSNKNNYAIVIGIELYRQKLPKADFAAQDAKTVTEYLTKVLGYPEENVVTLLNDGALKSDFEKYFEKWLGNNVKKDSTVFIYYSGHGAPDPRTGSAYLVPYDGDPSFIDETGYSLKRMYAALAKLPAKEIIVALDSCFSGAGGRSVIAKGARPLVLNLQNTAVLPSNVTVLAASSGDQISSTYEEKGHGLFTYFLLKGIKNEDVVKPDGSLAIDELYSYVKPQVERIARKQYNNEQTPQLLEQSKN
jgi:hypothetical protein